MTKMIRQAKNNKMIIAKPPRILKQEKCIFKYQIS